MSDLDQGDHLWLNALKCIFFLVCALLFHYKLTQKKVYGSCVDLNNVHGLCLRRTCSCGWITCWSKLCFSAPIRNIDRDNKEVYIHHTTPTKDKYSSIHKTSVEGAKWQCASLASTLLLFDPFSITLGLYYRRVVNGVAERKRDREGREPDRGVSKWEPVGVIFSHLMREKNTCFQFCQMTVSRRETISSFCSILVISSPASSAHPVIVSDWPYLSLTAVATISVGGVERWQFD